MAITDRYRSPADLPGRIPVFPLTGAILLPRAALPLNIFEPRYLAMLDDVVSGHRILGVIQPERASEESPRGKTVALKRIGCAGRVTGYQELDDGRLLVTLTGVARFRLEAEVDTPRPFRTCQVSYDTFAADFAADVAAPKVDRDALLRVLASYLEAHGLRADWEAIVGTPTEPLINSLSVASPFGPEEKQALLEAADIEARAGVLVALAQMAIASSGGATTLQ